MVERKTVGSRIFDICNCAFLTLLAVICLYPMWHVLMGSISDPVSLTKHYGPIVLPLGHSVEGYKVVLNNPNIGMGYANTVFYVVVGTASRMLATLIGAYIISRRGFMFRKLLTFMMVFTMYFGGGMIPTFLVVSQLGLTKTIWGVMLPGVLSVYNTIVLRTSFNAIPPALEESARIDGAGDMRILLNVVLPLSGAALATITLFYVVGNWGAWYNALVYLQDRRDLYPLQMFLREMLIEDKTTDAYMNSLSGSSANVHLIKEITKYSVIIVSTLPILVVYPFIQKYFVKGVMLGSIKE